MGKIQKLFMIMAGLLTTLSTQAQMEVANTMNDVGEIPIQYALSPSGATTYQIPVDIYPDQEQFQPNLFFSYNSQQGESAVGYGWNIGGLSAITHVAGSIYYDGSTSPLSLTGDKLMLDGMRLIKTGTDVWQTEQGFIKVKKQAEGTLKACYPNGNTAIYEISSDAPFGYVLTEYRNIKGRTIKYVYSQADNLPYVQKIMYGENDGMYNDSIIFNYQNLNDGIIRYADGKSVRYSRLLNSVESYHKGKLWRRYVLTYKSEEVNLLVRLDCETENCVLNPVNFEYGEKKSIEYYHTSQMLMDYYFTNEDKEAKGYSSLVLSRGRFSNDYRSDGLVSYPQISTYKMVKFSNTGHIQFDSFYDINQTLLVYKELSGGTVTPVFFTAGKGFQQMTPADIDGKGTDALIKVNYYMEGPGALYPKGNREKLVISTYGSTIDPNNYKEYIYESDTYVRDGSLLSPRQRVFLLGDFNGDGKTELLAISSCRDHVNRSNKTISNALLVDLQNRTTLFDGDCFDYSFFQESSSEAAPDRLIAMDYNGDGKTDICLINQIGTYVYEFTGNGFKLLAYISSGNGGITSSLFKSNDRELLVADMNGDGNMDLVLSPRYSRLGEMCKHLGDDNCKGACRDESNLVATTASGYKIYINSSTGQECTIDPSVIQTTIKEDKGKTWIFVLSTGNSEYTSRSPGFTAYNSQLFHGFHETTGQNFMLVDVDNDGLPDLLRNVKGEVDLFLNINGKLSDTPQPRAKIELYNLKAQFATANVSQSYFWSGGLICVDDCYIRIYDYSRKENKERMIHNVTNSYGVKNNHSYVDIMSTVAASYEVGNGKFGLEYLSFPYTVMSPHCYVNVRSKKMDGNNILSWESYKYRNAVFHRAGFGFCGFQQIETTDVVNSRKTVSTLDPTIQGAEIGMATPTDTITRQYMKEVSSNKIALIKLQKESSRNALNGTKTTAEYQYNSYGQPTHIVISKGALIKEVTINEYLNIDNGTKYLLGLPSSSIIDKIRGDSIITQTSSIDYDTNYMPSHKISSINGKKMLEERFVYDTNLRPVIREQRSCESIDWLTTMYAYDSQGRLSRETNAMGLYVDYTYDTETGLLLATTDHKNRMIRNEYDEWGSRSAIYYPDGRVKRMFTAWCATTEPGLYVVTTTETGKPTVKTYFDLLNREVRNMQIRFDGKEMKTDKEYNTKTGLLERVSQPTTNVQPSYWNQYFYDNYGRCTSVHYASGKVDLHSYGVLTDTIIENGIRHIREYDEAGMLIQAIDPAGCIQYYYRPDGSPLVVMAPGEVQTRFYYDDRNRRIAIKDPSAGIRRTEYDTAGNIWKETDADGRVVEKEYDRYGRITRQQTLDLMTVFSYDSTDNQLLSSVSNNGTAIRYTYDTCGRMKIRREEGTDGKWLQKEYGYTVDGIPSSVSYTSETGKLVMEKLIYSNGYLFEVRLSDSTLVYRHDEENAFGQITRLSAGDMSRSYMFNEWGLPTKRKISRADGSVVFDHSYGFNVENNNLESRKDEFRSLTETFEYDNLNRLSIYAGVQVVYDNNGNILSKNDVGTLAYTNPNCPYAVTGLEPLAGKQLPTGMNITYTAAQRPAVIMQGTKCALFLYNADHARARMQLSDAGVVSLTRYYMGDNYEQDIDSTGISERLYLGGNYYSAPAVLVKQNGQAKVYYIHRDYLGSILQVVDAQGNVIEENSYDAWGSRRNPATQTVYAIGAEPKLMLGRGFTGHEHLDMFGLINMNARLYDPILGRFLSPDSYVQSPDFTQAFNRFSYCMNSPLCYVDENGEFWWIAAAAFVGGVINVATHWKNIDSFWDGLGYFGVGATAGAIGALTGGAAFAASGVAGGVVGGALSGLVAGATSGFILGSGNTLMAGGSLADAMYNGMNGMLSGAITGVALGGITGGAISYFRGENVWNGSAIAPGRNAFSLKNTPIEALERHRPNAFLPDEQPNIALLDNPTESVPEFSSTPTNNTIIDIQEIANRLKPGLEAPNSFQEVRVTIIENDFKLHFRVETHTGVDKMITDMNLHPEDYVRHANIELFKNVNGVWRPMKIPGTKVKNFHLFLDVINKYVK